MPEVDTPRVLVVDDRPDKLLALEAVLQSPDIELVTARSGREALRYSTGLDFAVILLDVRMPGMDGFETAAVMRQQTRTRNTPIIFISVVETDELVRRGYALGAVDYIHEPVPEILKAKVGVFVDLYRKNTDLTERRRMQVRLQAQYSVTQALTEAKRPADALPQVLQTIGEAFDWDWIAWWDVHNGTCEVGDIWNAPLAKAEHLVWLTRTLSLESGQGIPGRVHATRQPVWISDFRQDANFSRLSAAELEGWYSGVGFPVFTDSKLTGVIECFSRSIRLPDQAMIDALKSIGSHLGQAFARRQVEARQRAILDTALDCIITVDQHDCVIEWNPAAERTFGYSREEAVGRTMAELIVPQRLRAVHWRGLEQMITRGHGALLGKRVELPALRADGTEFPAEITITRIESNGSPLFTGFLRDITERKQAEDRLHRAKLEAEAANKAKDKFIAALSHELRTPLTPVIALLPSLLEIAELPDDVRTDLSMIKRNVELEARLIDDLLDVTRLTKGKLHLDLQNADAHQLAQQSLQIVRDAQAKNISLHVDLAAERRHVRVDTVRFQQVLWNVLKNAIKFTPEGGDVWISTSNPSDDWLEVSIRDNGIGIAPERLPRIFDAFEQGAAEASHRFGGLGLGLFISRALMEQQGGTIEVESAGIGQGSTFRIGLPLAEEIVPSEQPPPQVNEPFTRRSLRLLLVEDHASTREVLSRLLTQRGHMVRTAASVQAALELAAAANFDFVISDLGLPDGSGLDLMPQLKARYDLQGIALSGYGTEEDAAKSREAGFNIHFTKPVDFKQLETALLDLSETERNT